MNTKGISFRPENPLDVQNNAARAQCSKRKLLPKMQGSEEHIEYHMHSTIVVQLYIAKRSAGRMTCMLLYAIICYSSLCKNPSSSTADSCISCCRRAMLDRVMRGCHTAKGGQEDAEAEAGAVLPECNQFCRAVGTNEGNWSHDIHPLSPPVALASFSGQLSLSLLSLSDSMAPDGRTYSTGCAAGAVSGVCAQTPAGLYITFRHNSKFRKLNNTYSRRCSSRQCLPAYANPFSKPVDAA